MQKILIFRDGELISDFWIKKIDIDNFEKQELAKTMKQINANGWLYEKIYYTWGRQNPNFRGESIDELL